MNFLVFSTCFNTFRLFKNYEMDKKWILFSKIVFKIKFLKIKTRSLSNKPLNKLILVEILS